MCKRVNTIDFSIFKIARYLLKTFPNIVQLFATPFLGSYLTHTQTDTTNSGPGWFDGVKLTKEL